jgi:hypothetical protein
VSLDNRGMGIVAIRTEPAVVVMRSARGQHPGLIIA